jgi:hypothetical protein
MEAEPDEKVNSAPVSVFPVKFHTPGVSSKTAPWIVPVPEKHSIVSVIGLRLKKQKIEENYYIVFFCLKQMRLLKRFPYIRRLVSHAPHSFSQFGQ